MFKKGPFRHEPFNFISLKYNVEGLASGSKNPRNILELSILTLIIQMTLRKFCEVESIII